MSESKWKIPASVISFYKPFENTSYKQFENTNKEFDIPGYFRIQEVVGRGAYGVVVAAEDTRTGKMVAIKKIQKAFEHKIFAKRTLRELKLLRLLSHDNVLKLITILLPQSRSHFSDIYIVCELVEGDLYSIIKSNQPLENDHIKFILYQILRALKYTHSARVLHRDIKPKNILISAKCEVKLCDFGLARVYYDHKIEQKTDNLTDYVATRWYRAPELLLGNENYDEKIDIWSVGCVLAEMLIRKPFLMGTDWKNQLFLILELLGKPAPESIGFVENAKAREFLKNYESKGTSTFDGIFGKHKVVDVQALDLLRKLLIFDPTKRFKVEDALKHPYLGDLYCPEDEPVAQPLSEYEFEFERLDLNKEQIKDCIYEEILVHHFPDFRRKVAEAVKAKKGIYGHILANDNKDYVKFEKEDDEKLEQS
jgi:serine/threonine protein kinase